MIVKLYFTVELNVNNLSFYNALGVRIYLYAPLMLRIDTFLEPQMLIYSPFNLQRRTTSTKWLVLYSEVTL